MSHAHAAQGSSLGDDSPERIPACAPDSGTSIDVEAADLTSLWGAVQAALYEQVQHEQFETWFRRAALTEVGDGEVTIAVHNQFSSQFILEHYGERLQSAVRDVLGGRRTVKLVVDPTLPNVPTGDTPSTDDDPRTDGSVAAAAVSPDGPPAPTRRAARAPDPSRPRSGLSLNPNYRFDSFVVGPCNHFAYAAAVGVSESPGRTYNPFFLHGSVGLGKTHLMQSLCHALIDRDPSVNILYLSCETFVNHFIQALEGGNLQEFRDKYRNVDVLVVDDIHMLANKERTQDEFFHTFNTLYLDGKQIVLSSDSPPRDIPSLKDRLVSRFSSGLVTEMESPAYETRMAILRRKSKDRGHELPEDVARLLAERIDTNIRELEGAVNSLLGFAKVTGQKVSEDVARQCLRDLFESRSCEPSMDDIFRVVTTHFSVKLQDLQSRKRTAGIAYARQVGMYLTRRLTRHSLEEIGGYFGGRDHSTVLYGVQKITNLAQQDHATLETLRRLESELRPRA